MRSIERYFSGFFPKKDSKVFCKEGGTSNDKSTVEDQPLEEHEGCITTYLWKQ